MHLLHTDCTLFLFDSFKTSLHSNLQNPSNVHTSTTTKHCQRKAQLYTRIIARKHHRVRPRRQVRHGRRHPATARRENGIVRSSNGGGTTGKSRKHRQLARPHRSPRRRRRQLKKRHIHRLILMSDQAHKQPRALRTRNHKSRVACCVPWRTTPTCQFPFPRARQTSLDQSIPLRQQHRSMHTPLPRGTMDIDQEIASQARFVRGGNEGVRAWSKHATAAAAAGVTVRGGGGAEALPVGPASQNFFSLCVFGMERREVGR